MAKVSAVGRNIARLRSGRFSQQKLAVAAGVQRSTIADLERGASHDVQVSTLHRLAGALGVNTAELITEAKRDKRGAI